MADPTPNFSMANILRAQQALLSGSRAQAAEAPARQDDSDSPDAIHYLRIMKRWWLWSLMAGLIVMGVTIASQYTKTPVYSASSRILITRSVLGGGLSEELGNRRIYLSASTVAKLAGLPATRKRVSERLVGWLMGKNGDSAEVMPEISRGENIASPGLVGSPAFQDQLAALVLARADEEDVSVEISASFLGSSKFAVALANAAAYSLVEEFAAMRSEQRGLGKVKRARDRNLDQLEALDAEIRKINVDRIKQSIEGLPSDLDELLLLYKRTESEREQVETDLIEAEKVLSGLENASIGETPLDPAPPHLVARLIDLELDLEGFRRRYTEEHPRIIKQLEEIDDVKAAIERYRGKIVGLESMQQGSLAMDIVRQRARVAGVRARAERAAAKLQGIKEALAQTKPGAKPLELESKLRERRVAEDLAIALGGQLLRTEVLEDQDDSEASEGMEVIPARAATSRSSGTVTLLLGILIAIAAGAMTAMALEHLDVTVRSAMDVRTVGGLSTIGVVPYFDSEEFIMPDEPRSRPAEAFSMLRNAIRYASRNEPERMLLVTSPAPREGKSYVSSNLAVSFAQEGNTVIIVDADLRRGAEPLVTKESAPARGSLDLGLASYLESGVSLDEVIIPTAVGNLYVLPAGGAAVNPASALRTARMSALLEELHERFNVVIIDSPPVLPVVDSILMAPLVRGVLMVVHSGATRSGELAEAVSRLKHVEAPVIGAVLNRASPVNAGAAYAGYSAYDQYSR